VDRIATARNIDAARNSEGYYESERFRKVERRFTYEGDCEKARTSRKCKLEFQL